jgi:hypothetical protein
MASKKEKSTGKTIVHIEATRIDLELSPTQEGHSAIELDQALVRKGADVNMGGTKTLGGPTGGDFAGGGRGPALGAKHAADDATADHYGSREETNAALEEKVAIQNTRRLYGRP